MVHAAPTYSDDETFSDDVEKPAGNAFELPEGYEALRADPATQFEPLQLKAPEVREPSWLMQALESVLNWFAQIFGPFGSLISAAWPVLQWILIAGLVVFVLYLVVRLIGPMAARSTNPASEAGDEPEWQPKQDESLALLEDADALATQGRYDEAAHLLLKRSVGQIAQAKPDWVHPSSTARELASLPKLSESAKQAFSVISAVVESSLFALKRLSRDDWERARQAYADFALARLDAGLGDGRYHS